MAGDTFLFFLGRKLGYKAFELPLFRKVFTEKRIASARERILNNSTFICFIARFLPGLRAPVFLTSGIMGVHPVKFFALDGFAALISVPVWVYLGYYLGNNIDQLLEVAKQAQLYIIIAVAIAIFGYVAFKYFKREEPNPPKKSQD